MPPIWGMEDRTQGRVVGEDRVQFTFNSEADLHSVLNRGPWFVNGWMVALDQWTPNPQEDYLKTIAFWIRVRGLPIHMLKKPVVESLLGPLGKVEKVELHAKNSNSVEYVRALVQVNTEEPLQFRRVARLKSGVTYPTELEYEKLLRICYGCKRLTHDQDRCSYQIAVKDGLARTEEMSEQEPSLRKKLREKETKAKESLKKTSMKGVIIRNPQPSGSRSASKDNDARMAEKRKGKRVVTTPQRIWKPKSGGIGTQKTRSTEESIVDTRSSEGYSGAKSGSVGAGNWEDLKMIGGLKAVGEKELIRLPQRTFECDSAVHHPERRMMESLVKEVEAPPQCSKGWGDKVYSLQGQSQRLKVPSLQRDEDKITVMRETRRRRGGAHRRKRKSHPQSFRGWDV
ncbi:Uncharacterized protein Rs2_29668 [Raphanus sativus]|nr:Uncharacterized protein Rs2_29668 [Raphanus sativus]